MADKEGTIYPDFGRSGISGSQALSEMDVVVQLVESKIEAAEARTMLSLSEVKSELLDFVNAKSSKADVWGVGAAVIATILSVLAIAGDRFDGGIQLQSAVSEVTRQAQSSSDQNSLAIRELATRAEEADEKLDQILDSLTSLDEEQ